MTSKPTPFERMSAGYAKNAPAQAAERKEKLANLFKPNDRMERLIEMRAKNPDVLDSFDASTRIELALYQQQRDAAGYTGDDGDSAA